MDDFFLAVEKDFVPVDLQQRLRDDLHRLKQTHCKRLMDYIAKCRQIISQVEEMTEIDQIIFFQRNYDKELRNKSSTDVVQSCLKRLLLRLISNAHIWVVLTTTSSHLLVLVHIMWLGNYQMRQSQ